MDLPQDLGALSFEQFHALWKEMERMARKGWVAPRSYRDKMEAEAKRRLEVNGEKLDKIDRQIHRMERVKIADRIGRFT